ncbi:MAG TPA: transporter [Terrimicrobiaceae bacterium]
MVGPPGFYLRNDTFYYTATEGARPLGGRTAAEVDQDCWVNTTKLSWVAPFEILGGSFSSTRAIPVVINGRVSGSAVGLGRRGVFKSGDVSGLSDILGLPAQLGWEWRGHHLNLTPGIVVPTGSYDVDRLLNLGRHGVRCGFGLHVFKPQIRLRGFAGHGRALQL